jgi:hypothetical protein
MDRPVRVGASLWNSQPAALVALAGPAGQVVVAVPDTDDQPQIAAGTAQAIAQPSSARAVLNRVRQPGPVTPYGGQRQHRTGKPYAVGRTARTAGRGGRGAVAHGLLLRGGPGPWGVSDPMAPRGRPMMRDHYRFDDRNTGWNTLVCGAGQSVYPMSRIMSHIWVRAAADAASSVRETAYFSSHVR